MSAALKTPASPQPDPTLRVSLLGGASFAYAGRDIGLRNRKARAMLAYLTLSEAPEVQRERLAGLFWSEFGEQNARTTLRQAVHELGEAMAAAGCDGLLVRTRMAVGLRPGSVHLDVDELLAAVAAREAPDLLLREARLAETLLAGYDDLDPSFHGWLTARRQTLHDRLIRGLEDGYRETSLARRHRRRLAEAALRLDPTHEEACRVVMQAAAEDGEIGAALRAYDELYRLLGDDYDMEPSAPTQALVAEIKQGKFDTAPPAVAPPSTSPALSVEAEMRQVLLPERRTVEPAAPAAVPSKPALFIEKFAMSGIGEDQAHLVEGFRTELIACLARFREWYVTGMAVDQSTDPGGGGVPVSSRYGVTATVYKAGSVLNVVMVLQERPSNLAVWGERFELRLDSWFEAQQRIVRRIATTLKVQVSTERLTRLSNLPDASLEAHDLWLRVQATISGYRVDQWNRTAQMLARAIDRHPGFSPLYSSLVQMNNAVHFMQPGMFRDEAHVQRTLGLAQRAVALDPRDSRAHLCLGWALTFARRFSQAELSMEVARELNSNDSHTLLSSSLFYALKGDTERAIRQATAAIEMMLVPTMSNWSYLTKVRYLHGDYEGTVVAADRARDALLMAPVFRAAALCQLGRREEARHDLAHFYEIVRAAWAGDTPPTDEMIARWLLHLYPAARVEIWQRLRDGMALAGLPVAGIACPG